MDQGFEPQLIDSPPLKTFSTQISALPFQSLLRAGGNQRFSRDEAAPSHARLAFDCLNSLFVRRKQARIASYSPVSKQREIIKLHDSIASSRAAALSLKFGMKFSRLRSNGFRAARCALVFCTLAAATPALAQQKTGPGITGEDSLTWQGISLYGVIDIGVQYDTHGAPFTPYRPSASGNIVRQNSSGSVIGLTPSNMGQSRVGLQGVEGLSDEISAVFQIETFFNPQSGEIADSLKSLTVNNGRSLTTQSVGVDGSSAGQAFQTAWVGIKSERFGSITFGRQVTLLMEGTIKYDPNYNATAFGLLGASNTYSGGGAQEDNRLDSTAKYRVSFHDRVHVGALYKFSGSNGWANTAFQANIGGDFARISLDAYYSKENSAITATSLTADQVAGLPALGYSVSNSLAATISNNAAYALMALYQLDPVKFFAGYERIIYTNPKTPLSAGFQDIGGYVLAFVTNNAYNESKTVQVFWTGVRYAVTRNLDLTAAYYGYRQNAYGTGTQAHCTTALHSTCSGSFEAFSFDADYRFNQHFDAYLGAMYSGVHDGVASGYSFHTTNINPTIGVRYKF
jgi:predicted porin